MASQRTKDALSLTDDSGVIDAPSPHTRSESGFSPKVTTITGPPTAPLFEGRYRIVRQLGSGAMGVVHLAHDVNLDRLVALKVVAPARAESAEAVARLRREARGLAALRAPNVVGVHAFGEHEGTYFFAMEYVEGTDLETILDTEGSALALPRVVRILREVATGLAAVHGASLVHRDVKPANILVEDRTARTVLVDFGLADDALGADVTGGSPAYCPAEQIRGAPSSPAFDVYAFGVLAFELATGRLPFVAGDLETLVDLHETMTPPHVSTFAPVFAPLDDVIARALAKDPARRYPNGAALERDVLAATAEILRPPSQKEPRRAAVPNAKGKPSEIRRVLVVESNPAQRELLRRAVDTAFFWRPVDTAPASTLEIALGELRAWKPDLVVLGLSVPSVERDRFIAELESMGEAGLPLVGVILPASPVATHAPVGQSSTWTTARADLRELVRALQTAARGPSA